MKRADAIVLMKVAGYHHDTASFTRLIIEQGVSRSIANAAYLAGQRAKAAGVRCECRDCAKKEK